MPLDYDFVRHRCPGGFKSQASDPQLGQAENASVSKPGPFRIFTVSGAAGRSKLDGWESPTACPEDPDSANETIFASRGRQNPVDPVLV